MERWISVRSPLAAGFEHAAKLLLEDPATLLAEPSRGAGDGPVVVDLGVGVGKGGSVRQDVEVSFGVPCSAEGEAWVPISWQPSAHGHLLPSFEGVVEVVGTGDDAELAITGSYRVPLGLVGRFGDGLIGRRLAQQSMLVLLERMATQLDHRVSERLLHSGWHPAPYPADLREQPAPRAVSG